MMRSLAVLGAACASLLVARSAAAYAAPARGDTAVIFMYHHVSWAVAPGPYARDLTVTPQEFHAQLAWLRSHGCRVVSVDTLYDDVHRSMAARCEVALTFDDGYADVSTFALPTLQAFGDVGTCYVATALVGSPGHVTLAQLRSLHAAGMEIGAHTVHHVDLTAMPLAQASREIEMSAAALHGWLGVPITSFAYPAGKFDAAVVAQVREASFDNAVTTEPGDVHVASERYELPRYRIERGLGLRLMAAVLERRGGEQRVSPAIAHVARERIAGNDPALAEDIAVALLARGFSEQILKVHVLEVPPAAVAGIVLSGVKFHRGVSRKQFEADVSDMVELAFDAGPTIDEVDVWAAVPVAVAPGATVSGDYAVPTQKTVFSAAVQRSQWSSRRAGAGPLGTIYWDPGFLR